MKIREIKTALKNVYADYIEHIEDEEIKNIIKENSFISGGAIVSMLLNEKVNDYDIYFTDISKCERVIKYYFDKIKHFNCVIKKSDNKITISLKQYGGLYLNKDCPHKYYPKVITQNAITLTDNIQLIIKFIGNPDEIINNYDFEHCKCYYLPQENKLVLSQEALQSIITKELKYVSSEYPLASLIRVRKFIKNGWYINAGQLLKIVFQINDIDLKDPQILQEQLLGVDLLLFEQMLNELKDKKDINESELFKIIDKVFDLEESE